MNSLARKEGYLLIDDSASGGSKLEAATITCAHCQVTFIRNLGRTRPRGYCAKCDAYTCDGCSGLGCRPFWKYIEEEQTRLIQGANNG